MDGRLLYYEIEVNTETCYGSSIFFKRFILMLTFVHNYVWEIHM